MKLSPVLKRLVIWANACNSSISMLLASLPFPNTLASLSTGCGGHRDIDSSQFRLVLRRWTDVNPGLSFDQESDLVEVPLQTHCISHY